MWVSLSLRARLTGLGSCWSKLSCGRLSRRSDGVDRLLTTRRMDTVKDRTCTVLLRIRLLLFPRWRVCHLHPNTDSRSTTTTQQVNHLTRLIRPRRLRLPTVPRNPPGCGALILLEGFWMLSWPDGRWTFHRISGSISRLHAKMILALTQSDVMDLEVNALTVMFTCCHGQITDRMCTLLLSQLRCYLKLTRYFSLPLPTD